MRKNNIPKLLSIFFGIGLLGAQLPGTLNIYMQTFYITEIIKLPVSAYTILTTVSMAINSALSPFLGVIIDKGKPGRWGKIRKWLIIGPLFAIIPYTLTYSKIGNQLTTMIIIIIGYTLFILLKSLTTIAQIGMISKIATTSDEITLLSGRRALWTNVGRMAFSILSTSMIEFFTGVVGSRTIGYTALAAFSATIMFLFYGFEFLLTKGYDKNDTYNSTIHMPFNISYKETIKNIINNPTLMIVMIPHFCIEIIIAVLSAMTIYYYNYVAEMPGVFSIHLKLVNLVAILSSWATPFIAKKVTTKSTLIGAFVSIGLFLIISRIFAITSPYIFLLASAGVQLGIGVYMALCAGLYCDCALSVQSETGADTSTTIMGMFSFVGFASNLCSAFVIGLSLSVAGYSAGVLPSLKLKKGLANAYIMFPLIFAIIGGMCLLRYKPNNENLGEILADKDQTII